MSNSGAIVSKTDGGFQFQFVFNAAKQATENIANLTQDDKFLPRLIVWILFTCMIAALVVVQQTGRQMWTLIQKNTVRQVRFASDVTKHHHSD